MGHHLISNKIVNRVIPLTSRDDYVAVLELTQAGKICVWVTITHCLGLAETGRFYLSLRAPPPFVIAGEARQSVVSPPRLLSPDCIGTRKDMKGIGRKSMGEAGMIRFVKWLFFSGVQQAFFIRKAIISARFSC